MSGGFTEVPATHPAYVNPGRMIFSTTTGMLRPHPITAGLSRVMTFTGQSLTGAGDPILQLPPEAVDSVPSGPQLRSVSAANHRQAVALSTGAGRVVVLGEAGALSAQIDDRGEKMGMNVEGTDNQAFARNIFHWLSRAI